MSPTFSFTLNTTRSGTRRNPRQSQKSLRAGWPTSVKKLRLPVEWIKPLIWLFPVACGVTGATIVTHEYRREAELRQELAAFKSTEAASHAAETCTEDHAH